MGIIAIALDDDDMTTSESQRDPQPGPGRAQRTLDGLPASSFFGVSAIFHYLGPSFAVLLFVHLDVLAVAWLRIATAAAVFAVWRRPWRVFANASSKQRSALLSLGVVLAAMNTLFYLAVNRLPLSTVGAIEFLGVIILAATGARTPRNWCALVTALAGVLILADARFTLEPVGFAFAFANCVGFILYIALGHRIANTGTIHAATGGQRSDLSNIDQLGAAMVMAAIVAAPFGMVAAAPAFSHPTWLAWAIAVGVCSSVIPYVTDQLAMARLPRATFALMLSLLPAVATAVGLVILSQVPTWRDLAGISLVIGAIALHQPSETTKASVPRKGTSCSTHG